MTAKWKMPGLFTGVDADKCYREITSIGDAATPEQIVNIINLSGFGLGIGSGRSSGYGRYHVESII